MNSISEIQKLQNYLKINDFKTVIFGCEKLIKKDPNNPYLFKASLWRLFFIINYLFLL